MARRPRLAMAGGLHLVLLRGHNDQPVFADDADRAAFTVQLREAALKQQVAVHAYALAEREVLLLVTPVAAQGVGRLMQSLGRSYVAAFNRRHGRRGTLWDGRFRCCLVEAETLLLPTVVYVEQWPVRAAVASAALEWRWSSAQHHAGRARDPLVTDHPLYWALGNTPFERERVHTDALEAGIDAPTSERLEAALRSAGTVGSSAFAAEMAVRLGRPVQPVARGRPRKKTVPI